MIDKLTRLAILAVVLVAIVIGVQLIIANLEARCSHALSER